MSNPQAAQTAASSQSPEETHSNRPNPPSVAGDTADFPPESASLSGKHKSDSFGANTARSRSSEASSKNRGRNFAGSPPPSHRRASEPRKQGQGGGSPQPPQDKPHRRASEPPRRHQQATRDRRAHSKSEIVSSSVNDDASRAALALAAVAQAANASHKSPAEAAEIAKAQAHSITKKQSRRIHGPSHGSSLASRAEQRKIQPVRIEAIKRLIRDLSSSSRTSSDQFDNNTNWDVQKEMPPHIQAPSSILERLGKGENDAFLQHLLLLEYLRGIPDANDAPSSDGSSPLGKSETQQEQMKAAYAVERLKMILNKVESAYDSLSELLSSTSGEIMGDANSFIDPENFDPDQPVVVPDLLPPCIFREGDPTMKFFRACLGEDKPRRANRNQELKFSTDDDLTDRESVASNLDAVSDDGASKSEASFGGPETPERHGPSVFSNMFRKGNFNKKTFGAVFGKKKRNGKGAYGDFGETSENGEGVEYTVQIEREMLGLTVENVLERTVVRTVLAGGPAKKAGAKVGSLIVKVGNVETKNLTHFETIDELRQSQRPLQLVLRQISDDILRSAREEMGRLIRGAGFGKIIDSDFSSDSKDIGDFAHLKNSEGLIRNIGFYSGIIRKRWLEGASLSARGKRDESVLRAGEKLVWILTLFVMGLENESTRILHNGMTGERQPTQQQNNRYSHAAKDYSDAAKSVSKVLLDFVKKRVDPMHHSNTPRNFGYQQQSSGGRFGRGGAAGRDGRGRGRTGTPMVPGMAPGSTIPQEKLISQIGDVLQRTRTFLADPLSPPAALVRGELIATLCDILDADNEMELSEEENMSASFGGKAGPITDLGSAGSLLKLIVLNCPIMRSPECEEVLLKNELPDLDELRHRLGKKEVSTNDCHRLHAGNRFLAVVHRLAASRSTSSRITACSLGPVLWSHLDFPHQLQLRGVITRALHDVEVIVRKSTATVLHEIAELVYDQRCVPWLVLMCERAMTDPEPLLRSSAMTLTWHLAEHLPNAFLGDASKGSRYLRRLPSRDDPIFADVYLLQCKLLPVATRLAEDRAPQVRLAVAAQCDRLCDALGDHWSSVIIDVLVALLTDSDERVRSEAVICVPRLADIVLLSSPYGVVPAGESSVLDALLPAATKLQKDPSSSVRISLATAAGDLLTLLVGLQRSDDVPVSPGGMPSGHVGIRHQKRHVDERLIPLVQSLLHDTEPEVTSSALRAVTNASRGKAPDLHSRFTTEDDDSKSLSSMHSHTSTEKKDPVFIPVLSEEQVLRLVPTLSELANGKQWRVRQSAVEIVPALLGCTAEFKTRADIARLCIRLCRDKVDAVRKTAAECLCLGGGTLGSHRGDVSGEWITELVLPHIKECAKNSDFKQRLLSLKMVEVILKNDVCPPKWTLGDPRSESKHTPLRELLKVTLTLSTDKIANVKLNVGRVLESVLHVFDDEECRIIKYALLKQIKAETTKGDRKDRDVLYFAQRCVQKLRQKLEERIRPEESSSSSDSSTSGGK